MKIGTLISAILILLGTLLTSILIIGLLSETANMASFQSNTTLNGSFFYFGSFLLFWVGLIFFYITQMTTKKLFLLLSSIFGFVGVGFQSMGVLIPSGQSGVTWIQNGAFVIGGFALILSGLLMVIGCIQYRSHNKVAVISSILLFIIVAVNNAHFSVIRLYVIQDELLMVFNGFLLIYMGQNIFTFLHALIFSFSKKDLYADDGTDDMMSVETGDAFASYVPSGKKSKSSSSSSFGSSESSGKKKKSKKNKDAYSFDF